MSGPSAQAATSSLSSWTKQGASSAGTWVLAGDGNSVTQTINGAPTFFVSPFSKSSVTFDVDITPATSSDNDYVGVVLGYTHPVNDATCDSQNCVNNYLLLDWKQEPELNEQAGFSLIRVNGSVDVRDPNGEIPCFWTHTDTANCDVLATNFGSNLGWTEGAVNTLRITYGPGNVKVERVGSLATTTIFDLAGSFPAGRIGLYNYSQANVAYAVRDVADPAAATTTTTSTTLVPTTTTSTTIAAVAGTTTTVLRTTIARTGPNDTAQMIELGAGALLILGGALLFAARGKRPEGAYFQ